LLVVSLNKSLNGIASTFRYGFFIDKGFLYLYAVNSKYTEE